MPAPPRAASASLLVAATILSAACGGDGDPAPWIEAGELTAPAPTYRPWVRYWWPGQAVQPDTVATDLDRIRSAGFGGVELQAFDAALDPDLLADPADPVAITPAFHEAVNDLIAAATERGLLVDLTVGSGWPLGGLHVEPAGALTTLMWAERVVDGPTRLEIDTLRPDPSVFYRVAEIAEASFGERLGRFLPEHARLVGVWAAPITGGKRERSPLDLTDTLVLDVGRAADLTSLVADGRLVWDAPDGRWVVVSIFAGPNGEYLTLTAERGDPLATNPLDAAAVTRSLDVVFDGVTPATHGIFSDSLELKADRLFTSDFLAEFERRRGYALGPAILATIAQSADSFLLEAGQVRVAPEYDLGADDAKVRWDYAQTVEDLFVERYLGSARLWARDRGWAFRSQGYGIDVDVLRAAGAVDVPEAETLFAGGAEMFVRAVASGAALYGRPTVAAEAFSFILRDHMTTPLKVRAVADKLFASGVNGLVFHGFPYDAAGEYGITGWTPFSSPFGGGTTFASTFGPRWEFWDTLPALNRYVARAQRLMHEGAPASDVLVVLPFRGFPTSLALQEDHVEPLLGGHMDGVEPVSRDVPFASLSSLLGPPSPDRRARWLTALWPTVDALDAHGVTWSWVTPGTLGQVEVRDGIMVGAPLPNGQRALLGRELWLVDVESLTLDAMARVEALSAAGVTVRVAGAGPASSPSRADGPSADAAIARAVASLGAAMSPADALRAAVAEAIPFAVPSQPTAIRVSARHFSGKPRVLFFRNSTRVAQAARWNVDGCADAAWYDAWDDTWLPVDTSQPLDVALAAYSSRFLLCGAMAGAQRADAPRVLASQPVERWRVVAASAVSSDVTAAADLVTPLPDLRTVDGLAALAGRVVFTADIDLDVSCDARLVFEQVVGTVESSAGRSLVQPWTLPMGRLEAGPRTVSFTYRPPLRNELVARGVAGDAHYAQHAARADATIVTGVLGDVTLQCVGAPP